MKSKSRRIPGLLRSLAAAGGWLFAVRPLFVWLVAASLAALTGCTRSIKPLRPFSAESAGPAPDYRQPASWAARPELPTRPTTTGPAAPYQQPPIDTTADVFFVHRTTYFFRLGRWNARLRNRRLNRYTDRTSIRQQASVLGAAGRLFAPRYRQATLYLFFDQQSPAGQQALDLAYADVRAAFLDYLAHDNHGRPLILAGHSQGTYHATRLLHEFFDHDPQLRRQLVAAYLVGFQARPDEFQTLKPCADSLATGCYVAWNAALAGHAYPPYRGLLVTNPLTWTLDTLAAPAALNLGGAPRRLSQIDPAPTGAQVHEGLLWVQAPGRPGYPVLRIPGQRPLRYSYHLADYSLFYFNVRRNALARVRAWRVRHQAGG